MSLPSHDDWNEEGREEMLLSSSGEREKRSSATFSVLSMLLLFDQHFLPQHLRLFHELNDSFGMEFISRERNDWSHVSDSESYLIALPSLLTDFGIPSMQPFLQMTTFVEKEKRD